MTYEISYLKKSTGRPVPMTLILLILVYLGKDKIRINEKMFI